MAKPMSAASTNGAGPSQSTSCRRKRTRDPSSRPRRRRKPSAPTSCFLSPSSGLLSFLAAIASSSVVDGSPTPPPFLCPTIANDNISVRRRNRRDYPSSADPLSLPSSPISQRSVIRNIPDRFEQGKDGVWRRVDSYTLYGVCPNCATNTVSAIDDQAQVPPQNSTMTSTPKYNIENFPPGWKPVAKPYPEGRTTLILAMSLVLAFFICFLIIGCLFWRKNLRRKIKEQDLEVKVKRRRQAAGLAAEEAREIMAERESKSKQKIWARATARWKANARYSARQRRGKRISSAVRFTHARRSLSLDNSQEGLTSGNSSRQHSPAASRTASRRASAASFHQEPPVSLSIAASPTTPEVPTISVSPPIQQHSSPPAYHQEGQDCSKQSSAEGLFANDDFSSSSPSIRSRRPSASSIRLTSNDDDSGDLSSLSLTTVAHVATDDKSVLARLAEMASEPPLGDDEVQSHYIQPQVSAPEWLDEESEHFTETSISDDPSSQIPQSASSLFPPPPSKGEMAAPNFYDYPFTFEEMADLEPENGPSAPPFEETPSAPFVNEYDIPLIPSAPPLIQEDDFYAPDSLASAPESGPLSPHHLTAAPQNHDREGSSEMPPQSSPCGLLSPPNEYPIVGEGTLPDYHP